MASQSINSKKTIVVVGCGGVGKTSFINRVSGKLFDRKYQPTIGVQKSNPTIFGLHEWTFIEQPGQELYREMPVYDIDGAILMFDIHSKTSYKEIPSFIKRIKSAYGQIPMVICGNKLDQTTTQRKVPKNDNVYTEISSKSVDHYEKIFEKLV